MMIIIIITTRNICHTYIDRTNTNAKLLEEASMIAFPSRDDQRKILLFSEFHNLRRAKPLGHILRSTDWYRLCPAVPLESSMAKSELGSPGKLGYTMQRSLCGKRRLAEYLMKKPRYKIISSIMQVCKDSSKASAEGKPPFCCANAVS